MTTQTISNLPAVAGKVVLHAMGGAISWVFAKIISKPLLSAIVIVMSVGSIASLNNALFLQKQSHPSPFFAPKHEIALSENLISAPIPQILEQEISTPNISVVEPVLTIVAPTPAVSEAVAKIDHAQIVSLQKKLANLGYFSGVADGYYGPKTANAIRAFERYVGKKPVGALTPEIMQNIMAYKKTSSNQSAVNSVAVVSPVVISSSSGVVSANDLLEDPLMKIVRNAANMENISQVASNVKVDNKMIKDVQLALASLGFLHGKVDGVIGASTARAIREFEVFHNYKVSGEVSPELLDMLLGAGAKI